MSSVSCLMATRDRPELAKHSIDCYVRQKYPKKELIILSQGTPQTNEILREHLAGYPKENVMFLEAPMNISLGWMRNVLCEAAQGEILCQWDDDDLSHSQRVTTQQIALTRNRKAIACLYTQFLKWMSLPNTNEVYWTNWEGEYETSHRYLCGTIMFYRDDFFRYKSLLYPNYGRQSDREEDLNVLEKLMRDGDIVGLPQGWQYIYRFHGKNVYSLSHHLLALDVRWGKKVMGKDYLQCNQEMLKSVFKEMQIQDELHVKGLDGEAFIYEGSNEIRTTLPVGQTGI